MVRRNYPRSGSLGYRPRKRAKRELARFRTWPSGESVGLLGFAGYKVGMTHFIGVDGRKTSPTTGMDVSIPVTVLAVPPMKVFAMRTYKQDDTCIRTFKDFISPKVDKFLRRKLNSLKQGKEPDFKVLEGQNISDVTLLLHTQPFMTSTGSKKPQIIELGISGSNVEEKLTYAKEMLGKEINASDVFAENDYIDAKAVTTGKGMQGPMKRFGVARQRHKASKIRIVGSIGPWHPAAVMWSVPRPGQMGYHTRTDLNKKIIKMGTDGKEITPAGGFLTYGVANGPYIALAGSVPGPVNRVIGLRKSIRPPLKENVVLSEITYVSKKSQQ
ncbi:MAG: 50S ribosomal protein L3 [Candidatus Diapherotrites archaeon]|nr:50S ribosomal protein L3 [Candidatus Diapherotrites archaeon]